MWSPHTVPSYPYVDSQQYRLPPDGSPGFHETFGSHDFLPVYYNINPDLENPENTWGNYPGGGPEGTFTFQDGTVLNTTEYFNVIGIDMIYDDEYTLGMDREG